MEPTSQKRSSPPAMRRAQAGASPLGSLSVVATSLAVPRGEVAYGRALRLLKAHQALDDVGERAVAAHAAQEVIAGALRGEVRGLPGAGGKAHAGDIAGRVQDMQRLAQAVLIGAPPGDGVYNKQEPFHIHGAYSTER